MLQRMFFRAFFNELAQRGIRRIRHWKDSDEVNIRWKRAYEVLIETKQENEALKRLSQFLGPDPLTGSSPAFWENLFSLHPGRVDSDYVYLYLPHRALPQIEWLPNDLISRMADAFLTTISSLLYS